MKYLLNLFKNKASVMLMAVMLLGTSSWGHIHNLVLSPAPVNGYIAGQMVNLSWTVDIRHRGDLQVWFSPDSGRTWDSVATLPANTNTYQWRVPVPNNPQYFTRTGIVMVYQRNTDTQSNVPPRVTNLVPNEYNLFSNPLTIRSIVLSTEPNRKPQILSLNNAWLLTLLREAYGIR